MNKQGSLASDVTRAAPPPEQLAAATSGFDFPVVKVGVVGNITVYYDPDLGSEGEGLATNFLSLVTAPYEDMETYFGIAGGPVSVVVAPLSKSNDGNGGGYHHGGKFGVLYIDATFASTVDPLGVEVALYVSELSEEFMGEQNLGWKGNGSNGEGLSKFLASEQRLPGPFPRPLVSGPSWANAGFPDWVSKTESTDQNPVSSGCAVVYLHWMNLLGFDDAQITLAGGSTLAANYQKLTGKTTAYQDLRTALTGLTVTSDNPFTPVPAAGRWHHKDLTAAAGAPPVTGPANRPYGYLFPAQGTQHVIYSGDDHIHELWHNTQGWHHNDLTTAASAPQVLGNATGYVFVAQGTQHVVYVGHDDHVYELWDDTNGWHHNDLTALSGATATSLANPRPCGYMTAATGTQHVIYRGASDERIHELWHDANGWHQRDLCAATSAPAATGDPHGYVFVNRGTQHIVYQAGDKHIHELMYDSNGWHHSDLSAATSAPAALSDPSGYAFANQRTRHVTYGGIDQHVHELWWDATFGWHHSDLSAATGAPAIAGNSARANGYVFVAEGTQHVVYRGSDQHIHELRWDTHGWHHNDLSAATGAPASADLCDPHGYTFPAKGTQHVIYQGDDGHIHELWWG